MATLNTGSSIVDYLKSQGKDSSFNARKTMYESTYGGVFTGSASQNTQLLRGVTNTSPVMSSNTTRINDVQNSIRADQLASNLGSATPNANNQANVDVKNNNTSNTATNTQEEYITETRTDGNGQPYQVRIPNPNFNVSLNNTTNNTQTNTDSQKRMDEFLAVNPFAKEIFDDIKKGDAEIANTTKQLEDLRTRFDSNNQMLLDQITKRFQARRLELQDTNERLMALKADQGFDTGTARYTSDQYTGGLLNEERDAIKRMAELDAEELSLVVQAQNAKNDKDFELLNEMLGQAESARKQKQDTLNTLYKNMVDFEKNKDANTIEQKQKVYNFAQDQVATAAPEIIKQIDGLNPSLQEAFIENLAKQYGIDVPSLKGMIETERMSIAKAKGTLKTTATSSKTSSGSGSSSRTTNVSSSTNTSQYSPEIMSWANKIKDGSAKIADVPSALRGKVNLAVDSLQAETETKAKTISTAVEAVKQYLTPEDYDEKGFITAQSFKDILKDFTSMGYSRADVLKAFKDKLYTNKYKFAKNYGITEQEFEKYLKN